MNHTLEELVELRDLLRKAIDNEDAKASTLREIIALIKKQDDRYGESWVKTAVKVAPLTKGVTHSQSVVGTYQALHDAVTSRIAKMAPLRVVREAFRRLSKRTALR